ncbi:MAG: hypothetical protein WB765_22280, partial [Acidimicrobiales bacterium]
MPRWEGDFALRAVRLRAVLDGRLRAALVESSLRAAGIEVASAASLVTALDEPTALEGPMALDEPATAGNPSVDRVIPRSAKPDHSCSS